MVVSEFMMILLRKFIPEEQHALIEPTLTGFQKYLEIFRSCADDEAIIRILQKSGVDAKTAEDAVIFVPMAFGHRVLDELQLKYCGTYLLYHEDGSVEDKSVSAEVMWRVAYMKAGQLQSDPSIKELFLEIAHCSAEVRTTYSALNSGRTIDDLQKSSPGATIVNRRNKVT